ncbi:MAG: winged helix-turn-helix transcriptional regulator [Reyranellaceae bacterium]
MKREPYKHMNCSVAAALEIVGEPWTLLILRDAYQQVRRFEEFQRHLGIARNILTARLKKLVDNGILVKVQYQDRPRRFEYRLTDKGAAMFPVIVCLKEWGDRFGAKASFGPPLNLLDKESGELVRPALIDQGNGKQIELDSVRAVAGAGANPRSLDFMNWIDRQRSEGDKVASAA